MFRGDLARDGHPSTGSYLGAGLASQLALRWRFHGDGAVDGTPAVADGTVIVGTAAGTVVAIDASTGRERWAIRGLGAISDSPSISDKRVYIGTLTGHVHAIGLKHGERVWDWTAPSGSAIWASPVTYHDEVIVGVASPYGDQPLVAGRLYGLDASSGAVRWMTCLRADCAPGDGVWSTAAIDSRGVAFVGVGNPDDGVLAFDPMTGVSKWFTSLYPDDNRDLDVGASPLILTRDRREVVAQATVEGQFALLDALTGSIIRSTELVGGGAVRGLIASPAFDGVTIFAGSAGQPTGLFALDPSDLSVRWRHDGGRPVYSSPAVSRDVIVYGTGAVFGDLNTGSLVAVWTTDGRVLWEYDTHSAVRSGPAIAGDLVVVGDYAGEVLAFSPRR